MGLRHFKYRLRCRRRRRTVEWATAMEKLRAYASPHDSDAKMDPDALGLPVIADSTMMRRRRPRHRVQGFQQLD